MQMTFGAKRDFGVRLDRRRNKNEWGIINILYSENGNHDSIEDSET